MNKPAIFIAWKSYQRRLDAFKDRLNVYPIYIHFNWEEKSALHKVISYIFKFIYTFNILFKKKPSLVYVQAPPTFAVHAVWIYSKLSGAKYIVDAHNKMIYESFWCKMPLTKKVLRSSITVIVHNNYVAERAREKGIPYTILMDRPPEVDPQDYSCPKAFVEKPDKPRVVIPCSYDVDEPLDDMQKATLMLPDVSFFITWYKEKLPAKYIRGFGNNVLFTGFLPLREFNALLAHADAILVLTTQTGIQPSGATEALAFQKPLVVSNLPIIRELFPAGAVYVANEAAAIAEGIRKALRHQSQLEKEMVVFKAEKLQLWEQQFQTLAAKMRLHQTDG